MTTRPPLRALFFDVYGTCVAQRPPVADELWKVARSVLNDETSNISAEVREEASKVSYDEWFAFGRTWDQRVDDFADVGKRNDLVNWKEVDEYRIEALRTLLAEYNLVKVQDGIVTKGSLWDETQLAHLAKVWRRLTPWPDTCPGLEQLNKRFITVSLSNADNDQLKDLVAHGNIPFQHVYSADLFHSYKPNPKVYLGAAEKLGVRPEECALVAAHLGDLKGAKACGFQAFYVERPLEEKKPELLKENIPDVFIKENEGGFLALAERLGTKSN